MLGHLLQEELSAVVSEAQAIEIAKQHWAQDPTAGPGRVAFVGQNGSIGDAALNEPKIWCVMWTEGGYEAVFGDLRCCRRFG